MRSLVRLVPSRLRASAMAYMNGAPRSDSNAMLLQEMQTMLSAQQHLKTLNERYFPQSGMSQQEVVAATAARVGFQMPKQATDPADNLK
mmetsp:Transcript_29324/g.75602  ORF Transcript_29324/g.75602 Transcript_29324/m.75602 type:complete len:89 (+) Transcript_29324:101-367(+)